MFDLKPSWLPVGTTVETPDYEVYTKADNPIYGILWENRKCEDCQGGLDLTDKQADDQITEFKILAVPFEVVEYLTKSVDVHFREGFIKEAILNATGEKKNGKH